MADKTLFTRLKRVFSSDAVIRNVGGKQLRVVDINQIQSAGKIETNALLDRFTRLYIYNNRNIFNPNLNYQTLRAQYYSDYEAMDTDAIIGSALDLLADETTVKNENNELLTIKSTDENVQAILYNLFYDILNIEFNLWSWVRNMCKYGDFFLKLEIAEEFGVYNVIPYTVYNIVREEGFNEQNPSEIRFIYEPEGIAAATDPSFVHSANRGDKNIIIFDNYEVAHFRLLSDTNYLPYGRSYLEPARKTFKQLTLMEDAMLIHRIVRAPERRIFYVNVGGIPPNEVDQFMEKQVNQLKRAPHMDPNTGEYNLRYNMQNLLEDFIIPVRGNDSSTRIDTAKGLEYDGTQDIEYLLQKLFAALKIPKAYFGYEGDLQGKATLAAEDIRFARTIERIQRIIESELTKIALIHLYTQGYRGENLVNFELSLTSPSIIYEQERIALLSEKINLANTMINSKLLPSDYIYENIFNFTEKQYNEYRELVAQDAVHMFRVNQIETEGNDPAKTGKSYGTPHDLATLYQARRDGDEPPGYGDDGDGPGRPKEKFSIYDTQDDPLGRDRLGRGDMKGKYPNEEDRNTNALDIRNSGLAEGEDKDIVNNTRTKGVYFKNRDILNDKKIILYERNIDDYSDLLDERHIRDL